MPSRNGYVTATCVVCGDPLPAGRPRTSCSDACRQKAWRLRHQPEVKLPDRPATEPRRLHTVYQCPTCETRQLGVQRCEDCRTFMVRRGTGGTCPGCDEPITFDERIGA